VGRPSVNADGIHEKLIRKLKIMKFLNRGSIRRNRHNKKLKAQGVSYEKKISL